jgi:two-component sensor histidine kinase
MVGRTKNWWQSIWRIGLAPRSMPALLFAAACVGIATAFRIGLGLISPDSAVFAPYYSATLVAALVGGAGAGALAAVLGSIVGFWLFVPPEWNIEPFRVEQAVSLILYGTSSVVIIWAAHSYRGLLQRLRSEYTRRELLNRELLHRFKNVLASVQGIVGQTLKEEQHLLNTVRARIAALAATNELLLKSGSHSASLRDIILNEFAPYGFSRLRLQGEHIDCPDELAIPLALVVHELTTNAVKYGALSTPEGTIDVNWSKAGRRLCLTWVERGGPPPRSPAHAGFGTRLLHSSARQFSGVVDCAFESSGFRCTLSLVLPDSVRGEGMPSQIVPLPESEFPVGSAEEHAPNDFGARAY